MNFYMRSFLLSIRKYLSPVIFCFLLALTNQSLNAGNVIPNSQDNEKYLNVTSFGTLCYWNSTDSILGEEIPNGDLISDIKGPINNIGVRWWSARDLQRFEILCEPKITDEIAASMKIEYWHNTWPDKSPDMPSYEDMEDDLWQGKWITAKTNIKISGNKIVYTFQPLSEEEITTAGNLPGSVNYRRTLKIRARYPEKYQNRIKKIDVFSMASLNEDNIRIEFLNRNKKTKSFTGEIAIYNGFLKKLTGWNWKKGDIKNSENSWNISATTNKGIVLKALTSKELLPGSNEETIITVRSSDGTFSFAPTDLLKGPIYIPDFNVYITKSDDPVAFQETMIIKGKNIRDQVKEEQEQSYERARKEIPHLDPLHDQFGSRIYLPLACDANWQKFAIEWGGNIVIDRNKAKVTGKALSLCTWNGDALEWYFGTGLTPRYDRDQTNCRMSVLNNYLPIVSSDWNHDGLLFHEEAFVTLSNNSPLSPSDPGRNEYTPAILMVQMKISNPSLSPKVAHIWLKGNNALTHATFEKGFILDQVHDEEFLRCYTKSETDEPLKTELFQEDGLSGIHQEIELEPNSSKTLYFYFPFIGNQTFSDLAVFSKLDYFTEKERVVKYWRELVAKNTVFNVPEQGFNSLSKSVMPHIRMSVTKDPQSGLFMVPAASFNYAVYANESIFQTVLLDRMGDFKTGTSYLDTFMKLQGSRKLPGAYAGDQSAVFHGVKIDDNNDLTAVGYNMNHGTVLWGLAHHYVYSKDKEWLKEAAPHMIKAADWIIEQRNQTKETNDRGDRVLHYGLLPAGMLEDCPEWKYWYATNAYSYFGLQAMADAFDEAGLPNAVYYKKEAQSYRDDIRESLKRAIELSPVVRLRDNTYVPYVPVSPYQRFRYFGSKKSKYYDRYEKGIYPTLRLSATREVLYGPVTLLKLGIIDTESPVVDWILDDWEDNLTLSSSLNLNTHGWVDDEYWFSRGGMVFQANLQNPVDIYLQRHENKAALRSLYNSFVALFYPDIIALSEEYRMWEHASGPFYKTPDEARFVSQVIDLLLMEWGNEVWLGNGIPERWLEPGQKVELSGVNTSYGMVSYSLYAGNTPNTIEADISLPDDYPRTLFFVNAPYRTLIQSVKINGQVWSEWDASKKVITLPQNQKTIHLLVKY